MTSLEAHPDLEGEELSVALLEGNVSIPLTENEKTWQTRTSPVENPEKVSDLGGHIEPDQTPGYYEILEQSPESFQHIEEERDLPRIRVIKELKHLDKTGYVEPLQDPAGEGYRGNSFRLTGKARESYSEASETGSEQIVSKFKEW